MGKILSLLILAALLWGCHPQSCDIEPQILYYPPERVIKDLPPCFEPLNAEEKQTDWGKEILIGNSFARELDFYRAITSYKRALVLMPANFANMRAEVNFNILLSYYLGNKYQEVIETFEFSELNKVPKTFPALRSMLIILYEAYLKVEDPSRAAAMLKLLEQCDPEAAGNLALYTAIKKVDFCAIEERLAQNKESDGPDLDEWLQNYHRERKSPQKAQLLNAALPGAGYYYVGQKKSALTSFLINTLFIAATYEFAHRGYVAAAVITGSLEAGWYFGGINGAGLAARSYNEQLYSSTGKEFMIKHRLFPVLMFQCAF